MNKQNSFEVTGRNRIRRVAKRAEYDRDAVFQVFDQAWICNVGISGEQGPIIIPMLHARIEDRLIFHGATSSRLMQYLSSGEQVCLSVAMADGIVLARSLFHHSMNYRSAIAFGAGRLLSREKERLEALKAITDKVMPGRWDDARQPNAKEMKATAVVAVKIEAASAKVRRGGPLDDEEDYQLDVWAGVLPVKETYQPPIPDAKLSLDIPIPPYVTRFAKERNLHCQYSVGSRTI